MDEVAALLREVIATGSARRGLGLWEQLGRT